MVQVNETVSGTYICPACKGAKFIVKKIWDDAKKIEGICRRCGAVSRHDLEHPAPAPLEVPDFACKWCGGGMENARARGQHQRWCGKNPNTEEPKNGRRRRAPMQTSASPFPVREVPAAAARTYADALRKEAALHAALGKGLLQAAELLERELLFIEKNARAIEKAVAP